MEEAQEPATKPEAEGRRVLRHEGERSVVQAELLHRVPQVRVVVGVGGEEAGEDHRLGLREAGQRLGRRASCLRDRVADARGVQVLDVRPEESDLSDRELCDRLPLGLQDPGLLDLGFEGRRHGADLHPRRESPVHDPDERGDAAVRVVPGIEDQRIERRLRIPGRGRHGRYDALEQLLDPDPLLGGGENSVSGRDADDLLDLFPRPLGLGRREVDLVDDGHDRQVVVDREVGVGESLRLDSLGGVHDENRSLARGEGPRDLVGEVDVAGSVDQIQGVVPAVPRAIAQRDGSRLDGDSPLLLELHVAPGHRPAHLENAVGKRSLAVVYVRHDREVTDETGLGHGESRQSTVNSRQVETPPSRSSSN